MRQKGFMNTEEFGHRLSVFFEKSNVFDPYAMALARKTKATVTQIQVVGHLPRDISQFCKFFCDYGGEHSTVVRVPKYQRSPILQEDWRSLSLSKYLRETLVTTYLKKWGDFWKGFMWNLIKFRPQKALQAKMKVKFCKMFMNSPL